MTGSGSPRNSARVTRAIPGGCGVSRGRPPHPGLHTITVRATDNTGAVQTQDTAEPAPDGATGWHQVEFSVR